MQAIPLVLLLLFGLLATLLSALPTIQDQPQSTILPGSFEAGFPLQWYTQPRPQATIHCSSGLPQCTGPALFSPSPKLNPILFILDTAFYTTLAIGVTTASKATIRSRGSKRLEPSSKD